MDSPSGASPQRRSIFRTSRLAERFPIARPSSSARGPMPWTRHGTRSATCRSSSAENQWAAGSRHRSLRREVRSGRAGWCFLDTRFIRREGPSSAVTRICQRFGSRCSLCREARTPFGNAAEIRALLPTLQQATLHEIAGGDHSFKVPGGKAKQEPVFSRHPRHGCRMDAINGQLKQSLGSLLLPAGSTRNSPAALATAAFHSWAPS